MKTIIILSIYFAGVIGYAIALLLDNSCDSVLEHVRELFERVEVSGDKQLKLLVSVVVIFIVLAVCLLWPAALLAGIYGMIAKGRSKP